MRSAGVRGGEFAGRPAPGARGFARRDAAPTRRRNAGATVAGVLGTRLVFLATLTRFIATLSVFLTTLAVFLTTLAMFLTTPNM